MSDNSTNTGSEVRQRRTEDPHLSRETIEDFVLYFTSAEIEGEKRDFPSMWVRHGEGDNAVEYPLVMQAQMPIFCTADPRYVQADAPPLSEEFYTQLGIHISRLVHEGEYVIDDFWAWLPEDLPNGEGWCIYQTLRILKHDFIPFEVQELVERALKSAGEELGYEDVEEVEFVIDVPESPNPKEVEEDGE